MAVGLLYTIYRSAMDTMLQVAAGIAVLVVLVGLLYTGNRIGGGGPGFLKRAALLGLGAGAVDAGSQVATRNGRAMTYAPSPLNSNPYPGGIFGEALAAGYNYVYPPAPSPPPPPPPQPQPQAPFTAYPGQTDVDTYDHYSRLNQSAEMGPPLPPPPPPPPQPQPQAPFTAYPGQTDVDTYDYYSRFNQSAEMGPPLPPQPAPGMSTLEAGAAGAAAALLGGAVLAGGYTLLKPRPRYELIALSFITEKFRVMQPNIVTNFESYHSMCMDLQFVVGRAFKKLGGTAYNVYALAADDEDALLHLNNCRATGEARELVVNTVGTSLPVGYVLFMLAYAFECMNVVVTTLMAQRQINTNLSREKVCAIALCCLEATGYDSQQQPKPMDVDVLMEHLSLGKPCATKRETDDDRGARALEPTASQEARVGVPLEGTRSTVVNVPSEETEDQDSDVETMLLDYIQTAVLDMIPPGVQYYNLVNEALQRHMQDWYTTNEADMDSIRKLRAYQIPVTITREDSRGGTAMAQDFAIGARNTLDTFVAKFMNIDPVIWEQCNPNMHADRRREIYTGLANDPATAATRITPRVTGP